MLPDIAWLKLGCWFGVGLVGVWIWWRTIKNNGFVRADFLPACRLAPRRAFFYIGLSMLLGPVSLVGLVICLFVVNTQNK